MTEGTEKTLYEDIKYLISLNIGVIPLSKEIGNIRDVKINNNTKEDFKPTLKIHKNLYNEYILNNAIKNNIVGYYLECGERSNIFIVDVDNKKTTNNAIIEKIKILDTLTISTPSGGFHYIFKYTDKYKINSIALFNNIDIKTNNSITYFGIRNDGVYKIIDKSKEIKDISYNILNEFKEYRIEYLTNSINFNDKYLDDKYLNDNIEVKKGFNITEKELYILLLDLPEHYVNDYSGWVEITYLLKKYNFGNVWNLWSKKSLKYDKTNNIKIYNSLDINREYRDLNIIINILNKTNKYKDNKLNNIEKIFNEYKPMNKENIELITNKINSYLDKNIYKDGKDIIVWSGLGTGKTTSVKDYIKNSNNKVLTITLLEKTVNSLYNDFKKEYIECIYYKDLDPIDLKKKAENKCEQRYLKGQIEKIYITDEEKTYTEELEKIKKNINKKSIFITVDSILNLLKYNIDYTEYVVFLDEIHSLIKYLLVCENLKDKRKKLFSYLMNILKSSKQIIMSDGDICNNTIKLLQILKRGPFNFIKNDMKKYNGVRCYRQHNYYDLIEKMKDDINNNIYFTCACNTKETAKKIKLLLEDNIKDKKKLLLYTSEDGEKITDINKEWLEKYIIFSPSIVCGLDFNPLDGYNTYSIIEGETTLNPEEIAQQIARNRNIKELCIYINKMTNKRKYNNIEDVKKTVENGTNSYKEIFKDLIDTETNEDGTNINYKDNIFTSLLYELELQNDILKSSYYYNLFEILKNKGFKVERNILKSLSLEKAEHKRIKNEIKENKELILNKYINDELDQDDKLKCLFDRIIKNLDIPENKKEDLKKYNKILCDDKAINNHLNIRLLLTKPEILRLMNKEQLETDYIEILYKDKKPLVLILNDIFNEYLKNNISIFKYEYNHDEKYLNDTININDYYYNYIISVIRTKKPRPQTKGELLGLLNILLKSLFGRDIIKTKEIKITDETNKKRIAKTNYYFNDDLFKEHLELFRISLDNNNKYKYIYILDNIKNTYYNNIKITDKDYIEYNEYLTEKKENIEKDHKYNIKEYNKTETIFKKLITKTTNNKIKEEKQKREKKK